MLCEKCSTNMEKEKLIKSLIKKTLNNEFIWEEHIIIYRNMGLDRNGNVYDVEGYGYVLNFNNYVYEINKFISLSSYHSKYLYPSLKVKFEDKVIISIDDIISEKLILAIENKISIDSEIIEKINKTLE